MLFFIVVWDIVPSPYRYERIQKYALEYPEIEPAEDVSVKKLISKHSMLKSQSSNMEGRPEKKKRGRPRKYNIEKKLPSKPSKSNGDSTDGEFSGFDENSSFEEKKRRLALTTKLSKEGSFKVYAQKHLPKIMQDFPNISEETARNKLRWRWKKMSSSQTTRYKSKFSSSQNEGLNDTMKRKYEPSFENFLEDDSGASAAKRKRTEEYVENLRGVYKVVRNEKVCYRCESVSTKGGSDMVRCKGLCCGVFHLECIGLSSHPKRDFKCEECLTGQHKCFLCKSSDGILQRCTVPFCGKFYHERCIQKWPHVSKQRQQEVSNVSIFGIGIFGQLFKSENFVFISILIFYYCIFFIAFIHWRSDENSYILSSVTQCCCVYNHTSF